MEAEPEISLDNLFHGDYTKADDDSKLNVLELNDLSDLDITKTHEKSPAKIKKSSKIKF